MLPVCSGVSKRADGIPLRVFRDEPMSRHTTWRVGGPADVLVRASNPDNLLAALAWGHEQGLPVTVIGGGSNLLVGDRGIRGLVILARTPGERADGLVMVTIKLVVCPLAVWALATLVFEIPPLWAKVAIVLGAMPVGVNVYLFGVRYHAGEAESATAVLLSSILSLATLSLVLVWLDAGAP